MRVQSNLKGLIKKLKAYRVIHNVTQKELAEEIGVSEFTISRWESLYNSPSIMAERIIKRFLKEKGML